MGGDSAALPDEIKVPVFKLILKTGGAKEYGQVMEVFEKAESNLEKTNVFKAIGHTAELTHKKQVLEWAVSGAIKIQDFFYPVGSVAGSTKEAASMTWEFYKENFDKISSMLSTANPSLMDAMIQYSSMFFCTHDAANGVEQFFKEHPLKQNKRTIDQTLEGIRTNASFLDRVKATPVMDVAFWDTL